jgi:hypothetical protein
MKTHNNSNKGRKVSVIFIVLALFFLYVSFYGILRKTRIIQAYKVENLVTGQVETVISVGHDTRRNRRAKIKNSVAPYAHVMYSPLIWLEQFIISNP